MIDWLSLVRVIKLIFIYTLFNIFMIDWFILFIDDLLVSLVGRFILISRLIGWLFVTILLASLTYWLSVWCFYLLAFMCDWLDFFNNHRLTDLWCINLLIGWFMTLVYDILIDLSVDLLVYGFMVYWFIYYLWPEH